MTWKIANGVLLDEFIDWHWHVIFLTPKSDLGKLIMESLFGICLQLIFLGNKTHPWTAEDRRTVRFEPGLFFVLVNHHQLKQYNSLVSHCTRHVQKIIPSLFQINTLRTARIVKSCSREARDLKCQATTDQGFSLHLRDVRYIIRSETDSTYVQVIQTWLQTSYILNYVNYWFFPRATQYWRRPRWWTPIRCSQLVTNQ